MVASPDLGYAIAVDVEYAMPLACRTDDRYALTSGAIDAAAIARLLGAPEH